MRTFCATSATASPVLHATEMVRRAEYALGKAIRKGQAEGTVLEPGVTCRRPGVRAHGGRQPIRVSDIGAFKTGDERFEIYAMSDDVTPDQFEDALTEARDRGQPRAIIPIGIRPG